MKKTIFLVFSLSLFVSMNFALAGKGHDHGKSATGKGEKVYCCHGKGDCDKLHTKEDCEKDGGKVVKSCKECK